MGKKYEKPGLTVPEDEKISLNDVQKKVLRLIQCYGTSIYGEGYRLMQVAQAINELYFQLNEGSIMLSHFKFVKVAPAD